ncbi:MAG TPA: hypothetical protein VEC36_09465 [Patescibacteria group bacterium]|nr:hypothetical protein [Patescibacteria group bacterium]
MRDCSHNIQNLHGKNAFLKGAIMRIFVMAMLLLSLVGCGSIGENNSEYPALKVLKTERDSATGQVRVTVLLTRTSYTKKFYYYSEDWGTPLFIFKNTLSFSLNKNSENSKKVNNSNYNSYSSWFKLNRNMKPVLIDFDAYQYDQNLRLIQDLLEQKEFSILVPESELNQRIGITFYPMINNSGIQLDNPITIWTDEIPPLQ